MTGLGDLLQCLLLASEYRQYMMCWHCVYRALLAARVASASVTSVSALNAWTLRSGIAHPRMAYLYKGLRKDSRKNGHSLSERCNGVVFGLCQL